MKNKARKTSEHVCKHCGNPFTATRLDAHFCCNSCRQKAYLVRGRVKYLRILIDNIELWLQDQTRPGAVFHSGKVRTLKLDLSELKAHKYFIQLPHDHDLRKYVEGTLTDAVERVYYKYFPKGKD